MSKTLNGTGSSTEKKSFWSLVNAIAVAIIGLISLMSTDLGLGRFEDTFLYLQIIGVLFIFYLVLRLPVIIQTVGMAILEVKCEMYQRQLQVSSSSEEE
jgi:hypothetical protein